ncbi:hypothetical protein K469DRAFT_692065 [Zopfia rhizophila CBS 207.26]|uniref:Uncharacterized protein n=1 Tax=Zopfia rhizophila CBS 207.26 TaxID=1314779 RepID=A0A6A6DRT0_9PEZI|nr:hypothetical protein K469DRAFT_692065 [Zopfia rhizophila CBS 207.26]
MQFLKLLATSPVFISQAIGWGVYACDGPNFTGSCQYYPDIQPGSCFNADDGEISSIGPDPGHKCWLFQESNGCHDKAGTFKEIQYPGDRMVVFNVLSMCGERTEYQYD